MNHRVEKTEAEGSFRPESEVETIRYSLPHDFIHLFFFSVALEEL
jgi:hypothetical protein